MQQRGVIAFVHEMQQVIRRVNVHRERVAQVGIEIGQPGTVDDQIERPPQALLYFGSKAEAGLAGVSLRPLPPDRAGNPQTGRRDVLRDRSKTGDSETMRSKRWSAVAERWPRISRWMRPISGSSVSRFASHTLPMKPVPPMSSICFPRIVARTEKGARLLCESK